MKVAQNEAHLKDGKETTDFDQAIDHWIRVKHIAVVRVADSKIYKSFSLFDLIWQTKTLCNLCPCLNVRCHPIFVPDRVIFVYLNNFANSFKSLTNMAFCRLKVSLLDFTVGDFCVEVLDKSVWSAFRQILDIEFKHETIVIWICQIQ